MGRGAILNDPVRPSPAQLQINQGRAWRAIVDLDLDHLPIEVFEASDQLARAAAPEERARRTLMRIVRTSVQQLGPGRFEPYEVYLWTWQYGWQRAQT